MEGLSVSKRRWYLAGLVVAFVVFSPLLGLYAAGYRLTTDLTFIRTGGIHVDVPLSGASFFLNDEHQGVGSLFQKSFFVQNLLPDTYVVRIEREGFHGWRKELPVYPTLITGARAFLTPEVPQLVEIPRLLTAADAGATSTRTSPRSTSNNAQNPRYRDIIEHFDGSSPTSVATSTIVYNNSTTTVRVSGGIGLWKDEAGLHAWWLESEERFPYFFCKTDTCEREILVAGADSGVGHFDFAPESNQFVIVEWPDGVFLTELDTRIPQNIHPLYPVPGAAFRVVDDALYVRDDVNLFEVLR